MLILNSETKWRGKGARGGRKGDEICLKQFPVGSPVSYRRENGTFEKGTCHKEGRGDN